MIYGIVLNLVCRQTKIYVISLKRLPERRKFMEAQLSTLGLEAEFVEAVDGLELSEATIKANYNDQGRNYTDPRRMTPTEIGCAWSHRNVYKRLIDSEEKYALILEDDAILPPEIVPFLELIPKIPSDWELISLCWSNLVNMKPYIFRWKFPFNLYNQHKFGLGSPPREYRLGELLVPIFRAVAYIVSRQGAEVLTRHNTPITSLTDHVFANTTPGKLWAVKPDLVSYTVLGKGITTRSYHDLGPPPPPPNHWTLLRRFNRCYHYEYRQESPEKYERKLLFKWNIARMLITALYLMTGFHIRRKWPNL